MKVKRQVKILIKLQVIRLWRPHVSNQQQEGATAAQFDITVKTPLHKRIVFSGCGVTISHTMSK